MMKRMRNGRAPRWSKRSSRAASPKLTRGSHPSATKARGSLNQRMKGEGGGMKYVSTRASSPPLGLSEAIQTGLAPDGGLYVPERFPKFETEEFDGAESLPDIAERFVTPFFEGDELSV